MASHLSYYLADVLNMDSKALEATGTVLSIPLFIIGIISFALGLFVPVLVATPFLFLGLS